MRRDEQKKTESEFKKNKEFRQKVFGIDSE